MHTTTRVLRTLNEAPIPTAAPSFPADRVHRMARGILLLVEARDYAALVHRDIWDFAVELSSLQSAGLTNSEIRCMLCMGYIKHIREQVDSGSDGARRFCEDRFLTFCDQSCFVVTEEGAAVFERLIAPNRTASVSSDHERHADESQPTPACTPVWDGERQELRVGGRLVKQFKLRSPNQEMVLSSFQEEGWPARIDDPLPPVADIVPKRRLHDTIKSLNRCQKCRLIRFLGDGSGEGVRWELNVPELNQALLAISPLLLDRRTALPRNDR
jgi:hypothetical protein